MPKEPCRTCGGSGEKRRVVNRKWPKGDKPYVEPTGDPCGRCKGRGYIR